MMGPYTGFHINIPVYRVTRPPAFSWLTGFNFAVRAGSGLFFTDAGFSADLGKSSLTAKSAPPLKYNRFNFYVGVGYKWGFLSGRQTLKEHFNRIFKRSESDEPAEEP